MIEISSVEIYLYINWKYSKNLLLAYIFSFKSWINRFMRFAAFQCQLTYQLITSWILNKTKLFLNYNIFTKQYKTIQINRSC